MLPYSNPEGRKHENVGSSRRYSLFQQNATAASSSTSSSRIRFGVISDSNAGKQSPRRQTIDITGPICQNCKRFEVDLTNTSDHLTATDAELKASRQVISLLQRQLELLRVEKDGLEKLIISQSNSDAVIPATDILKKNLLIDVSEIPAQSGSVDTDKQQMLLKLIRTELYAKDEEIVKLNFNLKEIKNDKEQLLLQLHQLEEDNARLKSENSILNENLCLRDQTIVSLSNELFEQGKPTETRRRQSAFENSSNQQSLIKAQRQVAKLIDTLDAYKKTNELLSNNVTTLTSRCSDMERKEIESRSQCQELEAKCCQIQSKLLSLLKEIEQSSKQRESNGEADGDVKSQEVIGSESVKLLIKRLLEDRSLDIPLSWKEGNKPTKEDNKYTNSKYECDELGFYIDTDTVKGKQTSRSRVETKGISGRFNDRQTLDELPEEEEAQNQAEILRQTSVDASKNDEYSWHLRWDNFIKDFDKVELKKSREFKALLRTAVPQEYRCKVWKALVDLHIGKERLKYGIDYYQSLLEPNRPLDSTRKGLNPSSKQIELDLLRTLPNNKHFENIDSSGTVRLRRVLTAYSEHNPRVGYCQGMNRLAAVSLLVLPEEEAFWCLVAIVDSIMPVGYYNDLWLAQVDSAVVMDYVALKMPLLCEHFKVNSIDLSLFAWFLTIFVDGAPPTIFLRTWDCFLFEGDKILFRIALALLKVHEEELMKLTNSVAVNNFLRSSISSPLDVDQLFNVAFECINPLSTRSLRIKRQHQFKLMRSGFESSDNCFFRNNSEVSDEDNDDCRNDDSPVEDSSIISI